MSTVEAPDAAASLSAVNAALAGEMPVIEKPPSGQVQLARGLFRDGTWYKDAVVKELTGADEEVYSRIDVMEDPLKYQDVVLERGTVSIGGAKVSGMDLAGLIIGDRNALYLAIRVATYGDEIEFKGECEHCNTAIDVFVSLKEDVPVVTIDDVDLALHQIKLTNNEDTLYVSIPTGRDQNASFAGAGKVNMSERNSLFMSRCIHKLNGEDIMDRLAYAKNLGLRDRAKVLEFLTKQPGPVPGEVEVPCEACGRMNTVILSWANLLRF